MRHATLSGYWVLIQVSLGYSHLRDRFLTCYAPVRHSPLGPKSRIVRLACIKHAASVRPEPGSNSPSRSRHEDQGPHDTIEEPLLRFNGVENTPDATAGWNCCNVLVWQAIRKRCLLNGCVMTMSGLTRLCGSISGYVSNSRSPALAFIVLCSVVKERCGHIKRQHTDTRLPVKAKRRCRSHSALRKQRLRAKGHPTGAKGTAATFQPLFMAKY